MIYIHSLADFSPKTAEIESTLAIRELKKRHSFPLEDDGLRREFLTLFISGTDRESMLKAAELAGSLVDELKLLFARKDTNYEPISIKRAVDTLSSLHEPLLNTLKYAEEMKEWKDVLAKELVIILNAIPHLRAREEKLYYNERVKAVFEKLLRGKDFAFSSRGIVGEAEVNHIKGLAEAMSHGFLFRRSIEDELKKRSFEQIKSRIPQLELDSADSMLQRILDVKKGIDRAYEGNMRMVSLAVIVYSLVKWAGSAKPSVL